MKRTSSGVRQRDTTPRATEGIAVALAVAASAEALRRAGACKKAKRGRGRRRSPPGGSEREARNTQPAHYLRILRSHQKTGRQMGGGNLEQYRKVQKRVWRSRNKETAKAGPLLPGSSVTVREGGRPELAGWDHTKLHFPQNVPLQRISVSKAVSLQKYK